MTIRILSGLLFLAARILVEPGAANAQTIKTYNYTGRNFETGFNSPRFSLSDSITGTFSIDCALAGGTGDCRSLPVADYAAELTSFSFTASGSPDLTITSADALPSFVFEFETDANAEIDGMYRMTVDSSFNSVLEGGNATIILDDQTSQVKARRGAAGGEGQAVSRQGVWLLAQPNLVVNGSFEDPIIPDNPGISGTASPVGWTSDGGFEIWRNWMGFMAYEGSQNLEMDVRGNTTIVQDLATVPGATYRLSFALANRDPSLSGVGSDISRIEASWDGNVVLTAERTEFTWEVFETLVTATSATTRLQLRAAGPEERSHVGDLLDDVRVVEAPDLSDLVENGSFEDPALPGTSSLTDVPAGWTSDGGFEIWRGLFGFMAQDGSQHLEMDVAANTTIFQDLVTVPGTTYRLSFALANRPDFPGGGGPGPALSRIEASWDANVVLTAERTESTWKVFETFVTATKSTTRLELRAAGTSDGLGDFLDDVQVVEAPDLVENGSFEDPALPGTSSLTDVPAGWTSDGGFEIWRGLFGFMAQDGSQHLEMDVAANTTIFQDLVTVPGTTYRLSFALANRPDFPGGGGPGPPLSRIEASWGGNPVLTAERSEATWQVFETLVTAAGATTRLLLRAGGVSDGLGDFLDDVRVVPAPDPGLMMLAPKITSIEPTSLIVGGDPTSGRCSSDGNGCTMSVFGTNFCDEAVVELRAPPFVRLLDETFFVNEMELSARLGSGDLRFPEMYQVVVNHPEESACPVKGDSNSMPFAVVAPVAPPGLSITSLMPDAVDAGTDTFSMTVTGLGFCSDSLVVVEFSAGLGTTFIDATQLSALVEDAQVANPGTLRVRVHNSMNSSCAIKGVSDAALLTVRGATGGDLSGAHMNGEINQARAVAGGVSPGDEPGFPVTLSRSGSYMLTGNLQVDDANTTAIMITASNVNLDLNGFAIQGPVQCEIRDAGAICIRTGDGNGISVRIPGRILTGSLGGRIHNGSVLGMGNAGISTELGWIISSITATGNGEVGISILSGVIENSLVMGNGGRGIQTSTGAVIRNNQVLLNGGTGISSESGNIFGNVVTGNGSYGIRSTDSMVRGNVVRGNVGIGIRSNQGTVLNNLIADNANPQLEMVRKTSWGSNNLISDKFDATPQDLFAIQPPGSHLVHETAPNTCNGQRCTGLL